MRLESPARRSTCAKNVSEVANRCVFSMNRGPWCSKSRLAKAAGAEVAVPRTGEKGHAAVAKSTFASQNAQNTTWAEPFWKLRCSKIARRCGAKHICKSKCTKHLSAGAILQVAIRKNGAPLWREAHCQVKIVKNWRVRTTFWGSDVEKWHAAVAPSTFLRRHVQTTCVLQHFPWFLTNYS